MILISRLLYVSYMDLEQARLQNSGVGGGGGGEYGIFWRFKTIYLKHMPPTNIKPGTFVFSFTMLV